MPNITARHCETRVTKQTKVYDAKCAGLYVSVSPRGVATFNFKYFDPAQGRQRTVAVGIYSKAVPEVPDFGPEEARAKVCALRYRLGGAQLANSRGFFGRDARDQGGSASTQVDVWEAKNGGYPLRLTLQSSFREGAGAAGSLQVTINITDPNGADIKIEAPS